ncbi:MAG: cytochrome oxidase subunit III [Pseudomonadota bacterium]
MTTDSARFKTRCEIAGWVLFILSACGFIASSWRSGDLPSLIGGLFFLVACFVFLLPYVRRG